MKDYVGVAAAAAAVDRPEYWVREMVALGLVDDSRDNPGKGRRIALGLFEFYQLTALAAAFKYQKFRHIKFSKKWQEFNKALSEFFYSRDSSSYQYDIISTYDGYRAGWDFERLEKAASANYVMALKVEERTGTIPVRHRSHASV